MGAACLVTGSEALCGECGYCGCNLNMAHFTALVEHVFVIITEGKISTYKSPDMFTHLKHVYAKIKSLELKLVLCCHLVWWRCFAAKRDIFIYIYIYIV